MRLSACQTHELVGLLQYMQWRRQTDGTELLPWLQEPGLKPIFKPKFYTKVNLTFGLKPDLALRLRFGLKP